MMDGSRDYDLFVRQQPKQARMCGVGGMSFPIYIFSCLFVFVLFLLYLHFVRATPSNGVCELTPTDFFLLYPS